MRSILIKLFLFLAASPVMAQNVDTLTERSQARARATLDRAVAAIGGEAALRGVTSTTIRSEGIVRPRLQAPTPSPPFPDASQSEEVVIDLAGGWYSFAQRYRGFGVHNDYTITADGEEAKMFDHLARTVAPFAASQASDLRARAQRRLPHLILRQALASPNNLRHLGDATFEGRTHEVLMVLSAGQPLAVFIDAATGLISKYEALVMDPLEAEEALEIVFSDYVAHGKLLIPTRQTALQAGLAIAELKLRTEINTKPGTDAQATAARDYEHVGEPSQAPSVQQLGDGVHLVQNVAAPGYNVLVVEFADHLVAIDAPLSGTASDALIAHVRGLFPQKPIRHVVLTHHHGDHIGGLRSFIAEGAGVVTLPESRSLIEALAKAQHADRLAANPKALTLALVEKGRHVLQDASQTLQLINIGPTIHAQDILIAYLPRQRVVFQSDLFFGTPTIGSSIWATDQAEAEFADKLRALNLDVDVVAGGHGKTVSLRELQEAAKTKRASVSGS